MVSDCNVSKDNTRVFLRDCMLGMAEYPDKFFDLAIVDPQYGIQQDGRNNHTRSVNAKAKDYQSAARYDDRPPGPEYFAELFRVSKNQIIWGANHFGNLAPASCWIVWDKENGENDFADCELAWTSFPSAVRKFRFRWQGMLQGDMKNKQERIHPNEKPIPLYKWLLKNYATCRKCNNTGEIFEDVGDGNGAIKMDDCDCGILKNGFKILDTHLGSGSSRIAAYDMGFDFTGYEIDADYFAAQEKRFAQFKAQTKLFA